MNAGMEQYLRVFVNHQQDHRVQWLPLAEITANNGISESTKSTPVFAVQGVDPRISFVGEPTHERYQRRLDPGHVQGTMQHIHEHLRVEMRRSQAATEDAANRSRTPARNIQHGTQVWFDSRHVWTTRPTRKLNWKGLRPFNVLCQVSQYTYEPEVAAAIRIHQVQPV
jgi:hypothetical protein